MADQSKKYILGAYHGDDPFIFISYAHRDRVQAMDIVEHLVAASYRVWFDQGITPGSEWDSNIAKHVEKCHVFFALLSKAYLDSGNCQDELNYARENRCKRILIYLEDVELSGGLRMRLGQLPAYRKYESADLGQFYEELFAADGVADCLAEDGLVTDELPELENVVEEVPAQPVRRRRRIGETLRHSAHNILAAGILCGILLASWFGISYMRDAQLEKRQNEIYVCLKPEEEMDSETFSEAKEILTERLRELSGNDRLELTEDGQTLYGVLPLTLGGEEAVDLETLSAALDEILADDETTEDFYGFVEFPKSWEDVAEIDNAGEYQRNYYEIASPYVTVKYKIYSSEIRAGELQDILTILKNRLDMLEQPYAISVDETGTDDEDDYPVIYIRTGTARMGEPVIALLGWNSISVRSSFGNDTLYLDEESFSWEESEDGTIRILVDVGAYEDSTETLRELSASAFGDGDGKLYLTTGSDKYRVASADVSGEITDGKIVFSRFFLEGAESITEGQEWYLNLLECCLDTSLSEVLSYQKVSFGSLADQSFDENGSFGLQMDTSRDQAVTETIKQICPEADVAFDNSQMQTAIQLHLAVDEEFVSTATEMVETIFESCSFEDGYYHEIVFYLTDEDEQEGERARIYFFISNVRDGLYVNGALKNGRMSDYQEEFMEIVENDTFYLNYTVEGETNWWME